MRVPQFKVIIPFLAILGGCASLPSGPSVMALPGSGKDLETFRVSDLHCRAYAAQVVGAETTDPVARNAVVGAVVGAGAGAAIAGQSGAGVGAVTGAAVGGASGMDTPRLSGFYAQRRYDESYIQCMYAGGHRVPVPSWMAKSFVQGPAAFAPDLPPGSKIPPPPPNTPPTLTPPPDYVAPPPVR